MMDLKSLAETLHQVKQFRDLPLETVQEIVSAGKIRKYTQGEFISREGEPCAGMFALIEGNVNLCKFTPEGKVTVLTTLTPAVMFNVVSVLDGGPNPISSFAATEIVVWHISYTRFQELLIAIPHLGISMLSILAQRNRQLVSHYDDFSFRSVQSKLAKALVEISVQGTIPIDHSRYPIKVIAARITSEPEVIDRTLKIMQLDDLITCKRGEIIIKDMKRLQKLAQMDF